MILLRDLLILISCPLQSLVFKTDVNPNRYTYMARSPAFAHTSCFSLYCYAHFAYLEDQL